jgi:hypothetical protein
MWDPRRNLFAVIFALGWAGAVGTGAIMFVRSDQGRSAVAWALNALADDEHADKEGLEIPEGGGVEIVLKVERPDLPALGQANEAFEARDYVRAVELYTTVLQDRTLSKRERSALLLRRGAAYHSLGREEQSHADFSAWMNLLGMKAQGGTEAGSE